MSKLTHPRDWEMSVGSWRGALRFLLLGVLGATLCGLVVHYSVAASLSASAPQWALLLHAGEPRSLLVTIDRELNPPAAGQASTPPRPTPQRLKFLREQAVTAVLADPLSPQAYQLLALIAEMQGSVQNAEALMRAAARRSLHQGFALDWLMRRAFVKKNYAAVAFYADTLLRSGSASAQSVAPILTRMAEAKGAANQEVKKLLATNPWWRSGFFEASYAYISDARTPLDLFQSLATTPTPPTIRELNAYQSFLVQHGLYGPAYYVWLRFLPPEKLEAAGFLYNGGFEASPSGSPFDWQTPAGANVTVDFAAKPENPKDHALLIELGPGRVDFPGVSQTIMLAPGDYIFKGSFKGDLSGPRGVLWAVMCKEGGAALGQSQMLLGSFPDWRGFEFSFAVPETRCSAQSVSLSLAARSPSEQLASGEIWFDDVSIARDPQKAARD